MVGRWDPLTAGLPKMQEMEQKTEWGKEQQERWANWGQNMASKQGRNYGWACCHRAEGACHRSMGQTPTAELECPPGAPHKGFSGRGGLAPLVGPMAPLAAQPLPPPHAWPPTWLLPFTPLAAASGAPASALPEGDYRQLSACGPHPGTACSTLAPGCNATAPGKLGGMVQLVGW